MPASEVEDPGRSCGVEDPGRGYGDAGYKVAEE